jgi:hypothetical protein
MAWNGIKTWSNEPLTATDMNTYISDNLDALKNAVSAIGSPDANYTTTSTSFTNVDGTDTEGLFKHTITVSTGGSDVLCSFVGMANTSAAVNGSVLFNISVDGVDAVADDGITGFYSNAALLSVPCSFFYVLSNLSEGSHVIRLRWKSSSASNTCTLYAGGATAGRDVHGQFYVTY